MAVRLAGAGSGGSGYVLGQTHDINVTPFVDVMMVLLIVFMVAAPLATNTLKLDLPRTDVGRTPPANLIVISIDQAGRIFVTKPTLYGAPIDPAPLDLDGLTRALAHVGPSPRISVQADQRLRYGRFVAVLNRLQDDGYYNVNLIVTPRA